MQSVDDTSACQTLRTVERCSNPIDWLCFEAYVHYAYAVSSCWHYQKKNSAPYRNSFTYLLTCRPTFSYY